MKTLRIQLVRSSIGAKPDQRRTVTALGLRRINSAVVVEATPAIQGMVRKVSHLLAVEEVAARTKKDPAKAKAVKRPASGKTAAKKPAAGNSKE